MKYLKASIELKKLIEQTNELCLTKNCPVLNQRNFIVLKSDGGEEREIKMKEFSNEFLQTILEENRNSKAFVFTDLAATMVKDQKLTYFLYKGYHSEIEKGLVWFQAINGETAEPTGNLQFSNLEENVFYSVSTPDFEESTSNAMETDEQIEEGKSIVFIIGNHNEERLLHDIQRLIFDTVNNVQKHQGLKFKIILNINKFNGKPTAYFLKQLDFIKEYTHTSIQSEYPNCEFVFDLEI
ncbi:hypothetical protein [uncultured Sunxiuqinia sp.]|uniref:hypothetical protein n=1 Tax=uncultured Sunxiuqinia sp. TaxID=1573825 RepID=UPI002AA8CF66|nr:hypothetical protein [uncultured Sunxiuqinia sp.]